MPKNTAPQPEPDTQPDPATAADPAGRPDPAQPGPDDTSAPTAPPASAPLAGNRFFAWMRSLGLTREPGWVGGVCAGIASRLGVDPLIVRGVFVVVAVLGGPALLVYAAAWLLLPDRHDKIHLEEVFRGRLESPIAGIGALILFSMLPVAQGFWYAGSAFWGQPFWGESVGRALWTVVLLGLIVWFVAFVARRSGRVTETPATTDARPDTVPQAPAPASALSLAKTTPGERPAAPPATASQEEFAAWRAQQAQWKAENEAFRAQQASEQREASMAAQAQYRVEREARRAVERAHQARTRSNPLYSFVAIGASFVVGGFVTLAVGDGVSGASLLAGLGAMLAVLAVAIIVNGARGRRPGGSQGLAAVVLAVILVAAVLPHGSNISYASNARFTPVAGDSFTSVDGGAFSTSGDFVTGIGDTVLDLRGYFADPVPAGTTDQVYGNLTMVAGIGDVTVILPEDAQLSYDSAIARGSVDSSGLGVATAPVEGDAPDDLSARVVHLSVAIGSGDLVFQRAPATGNTIEGSN
jgi:phage shock protein PspC (stress-responsive transcriptional regulator)